MAKKSNKVKATKLKVSLPFGLGELEFEPDEIQQQAAWELYVELSTRIAVQPLGAEEGLLREALSSLYQIFQNTRLILRQAGPGVAHGGASSVGAIAIEVLNKGLRPFLAKWHPVLQTHEMKRPPKLSAAEHEHSWENYQECRQSLAALQRDMLQYVDVLAKLAGIR
jgi:hypothetical protein